MGASDWVEIEFRKILKETEKAFCIRTIDGQHMWLPKSQISDPEDYEEGDEEGSMSITEWIAGQKGL